MIIAAANVGTGLLFILISLPLLKGRIPMNHFYGMRIRRAFESDENWYRINRYGARQLILWSIPVILTGILALFIKFDDADNLPVLFLLAPAVAAITSALITYRHARTL
jgi:hypothetical protein